MFCEFIELILFYQVKKVTFRRVSLRYKNESTPEQTQDLSFFSK